jgi:DNA mismatch endonuclease (patch repair protein)
MIALVRGARRPLPNRGVVTAMLETSPPCPTSAERSAMMARIRARDTRPELVVRRWLHRRGFRYRLHSRTLPGTPDIVLRRHGTIVLVHGCFWHRHVGCRRATTPNTHRDYWEAKFARNIQRDLTIQAALRDQGWQVLIIWECETRTQELLAKRLQPLPGSS